MQIDEIAVEGYERVAHAIDAASGLNAFISIHDTTLGPALGGMRFWPYANDNEALTDVLRLSKGMTYKSAIARTGLGGGKSVVVGDPKKLKTPALLQAMGRFIDALEGRYITAEDVNIGTADLEEVRKSTKWVMGLPLDQGSSGNPSPITARGVYLGIRVCLEEVFGNDSPKDRHVAIQGVGAVASAVIDDLLADGARITACDIDAEKIERVRAAHPEVRWCDADEIYDVECDVFAPCALGAVVNDRTLDRLKTHIVAGAANNQLAEVRHGEALREREILYAPDFVINAGGVINIAVELEPNGYRRGRALDRLQSVAEALRSIFVVSRTEKIATNRAAIDIARSIVSSGS